VGGDGREKYQENTGKENIGKGLKKVRLEIPSAVLPSDGSEKRGKKASTPSALRDKTKASSPPKASRRYEHHKKGKERSTAWRKKSCEKERRGNQSCEQFSFGEEAYREKKKKLKGLSFTLQKGETQKKTPKFPIGPPVEGKKNWHRRVPPGREVQSWSPFSGSPRGRARENRKKKSQGEKERKPALNKEKRKKMAAWGNSGFDVQDSKGGAKKSTSKGRKGKAHVVLPKRNQAG